MSEIRSRSRAACRGAAVLATLLLLSAPPVASQVVRGTVIEEGFDEPIAQAEVILIDDEGEEKANALTDSLGVFRLQAPEAGSYTLSVRRIGFVTVATPVVNVATGEAVSVELRMSARAIPLDPLVVVQRRWYGISRLQQFYERAEWNDKLGRGRIFFREDLQNVSSIRHLIHQTPQRWRCPMQVLVDGLPISHLDDLDAFAAPDVVEGVEIYRGAAQVPIEYAYLNACSLALVWTRPTPGRPFSWKRTLVAGGILGTILLLVR